MSRQLWFAPVALCALLLVTFIVGCDEPNDADLPPQPYSLAAIYSAPSPILDVAVSGTTVGLAMGYAGYNLIDAASLSALTVIDSLRFNDLGNSCTAIAVDANNTLVATTSTDAFDPNRIWDYARKRRVSAFNATGVSDLNFYSRQDTTDFWFAQSGTDIRIISMRLVKADTVWSIVPGGSLWDFPINSAARMQNFSIRGDGTVALAYLAGVHLHDSRTSNSISEILTPGRTYDCDWYGDYVIVAAEYFMVVVDASDPENLAVVHQMEIRNADRLRQVAVDGSYAALMDDADGVYIVDISNVASPRLVQTVSLPEPSGVEAGNGRIYMGDEQRGLLIYTRRQ